MSACLPAHSYPQASDITLDVADGLKQGVILAWSLHSQFSFSDSEQPELTLEGAFAEYAAGPISPARPHVWAK